MRSTGGQARPGAAKFVATRPAILPVGESDRQGATRPLTQQCATRHDVSIGLAVPDSLNIIHTVWCRSPKTLTLRLAAGSMLSIARTAVGMAYLWALSAAERRERLAQIKREGGARAAPIMDGIYAAFEGLDRDGYCIVVAEFQKNTFGIAVPLVFDDGCKIMSPGGGSAKLDFKEAVLRRTIAPDPIRTAAKVHTTIADALELES
jgi:DNA-binding IclR family transcriptional regulator